MDGFEGKTKPARLEYPFEAMPEYGETQAVAPGVYWLRMPLPFELEWINLWLLEDGDGWVIVDTGLATSKTREYWRKIFSEKLEDKPVRRVIVTHMHPDHIGLAGWICKKYAAELWISRLEYITCRMLVADTGREAPDQAVDFYRTAGWEDKHIDGYRQRFGGFGHGVSQLPDGFVRLEDGQDIQIGGNSWQVVSGNGHSPEHSCLYCESLNLLISGDQLLPKISSNVSVFPTEPYANPLDDWLTSCAKLIVSVPEGVLVLPAHNEPFYGAHKRLQALIDGHEVAMKRLLKRLETPKRVVEVFGAIFGRKITDDLLSMATGEAIAHLNCLIARKQVLRKLDDNGIAYYTKVS